MRTRDVYLARDMTVRDSELVYIKLDVSHPISQLVIEYEITNGATSCADHEIHDDVTSIEVIDGSDVLFSLNGSDCRGINCLLHGKMPPAVFSEVGGATQKETFLIDFGRYLFDPEYALDPKQFTNPQLALNHSFTIDASAGFATGTGKLTVVARCIEEPNLRPRGFMMTKVVKPFTATANQEYSEDLPRDYPYRLVALRALLDDNGLADCIDRLELSIDNDAWVPFKLYADELKYFQREWFGTVRQTKTVLRADDDAFHTDIYEPELVDYRTTQDLDVATVEGVDANKVTPQLLVFTTAPSVDKDTTDRTCVCTVEGYMPHGLVALPMGNPMDPNDWLDARKHDSIKLKFKALAAFSGAIILQQARS